MVIREYVTTNGVTVRIADDCCVGISEEEKIRRRQALRRALDRIAATHAEGGRKNEDTDRD